MLSFARGLSFGAKSPNEPYDVVLAKMTTATTSQRQILLFWLPLAASWTLMGMEGPILQAIIARLPNLATQLAAFGIVMSVEIAIESPVIMLLATSTALVTNAQSYYTLRRFMIWVNLLVTLVAFLVAFTPLYRLLVSTLMGIPTHIAEAARPGMKVMTFWSAAIGFRRFQQGVLIRQGQTRWIGYGTMVRLVSSAGTGILLAVLVPLPGVYIASISLVAGVALEALFIGWAARPTVARILSWPGQGNGEILSFNDVARYHAPLAATSLLTLLIQPLIGAGLARMQFPEENLAAWPVVWGVLFIFRSPAFALPEAIITLISESGLLDPVRQFCRRVGIASSLALLILTASPLLTLYLRYLAGLPDSLSRFVVPGLVLGVFIPLVNSMHSWYRGLLMVGRLTGVIYWSMALGLVVAALVIFVGVKLRAPGVATGVTAMIASMLAEIYYLRKRSNSELRG
jgi:progressive ankylosis protein